MSKILVTGHQGLVGLNLVQRLKAERHEVFGLDLQTGFDLRDRTMLETYMGKIEPDVVYHLAANASETRGQISPVDMTELNMGIFMNVLKSSINAHVKRFMYTSSVAVYGEAHVPYKEDGPTIPKDVYGVNKLACEQVLRIMAKVYNFEYTIFRPHNIYGPGQNMADPTKNVVALFMRKLIEGHPYTLYDNGTMKRAFSFVEDVVDVFTKALDPTFANITMNVGSETVTSIKELSDLIQKITGIQGDVKIAPGRPQEISQFLADHSTQNKLVKYHETTLLEGLVRTWNWVKVQELEPLVLKEDEIIRGGL